MRRLTKRNGQTSIEYAMVIICVVAGLLGIFIYGRRAMQGNLRQNFDRMGEQYERGRTSGDITATVNRRARTNVQLHQPLTLHGRQGYGTHIIEDIEQDETTRHGDETVDEFGSSLWQ